MSQRDCSFASSQARRRQNISTSGTFSSHERSTNPGDTHVHGGGVTPQPDVGVLTAAVPSNSPSPKQRPSIINNRLEDPTLDETLNFAHIELFIHLNLDKELFNLGAGAKAWPSSLPLALKIGLASPYLLYQLLAFSARHLAYLYPTRSAPYLHQAVTLQTRAVSLFNAAWTEDVDRENCVAVLLFSSILGHHLLADTLAKRIPGGLDAFMTHYVQCLEMHRGIYTVASAGWPLLMESELEPILSSSSGFTSREPRGDQCRLVGELIDRSEALGEKDKEACRVAIRYLQVGIDAVLAEEKEDGEEELGNRYQMIFSWTMLAPPEFTGLLAAKRPEILVLLGYYALMLHYGRKLWQVGGAGAYMLGMIVDYLGPGWDHWLEHPRKVIAEDLE